MNPEAVKVSLIGIGAGIVLPVQSVVAPISGHWRDWVSDCNLIIAFLAGLCGLAWWARRLWVSFRSSNEDHE